MRRGRWAHHFPGLRVIEKKDLSRTQSFARPLSAPPPGSCAGASPVCWSWWGWTKKADQYPGELPAASSCGHRPAWVNNPSTDIADEPTGNSGPHSDPGDHDAAGADQRAGTTLLVVTKKSLVNPVLQTSQMSPRNGRIISDWVRRVLQQWRDDLTENAISRGLPISLSSPTASCPLPLCA